MEVSDVSCVTRYSLTAATFHAEGTMPSMITRGLGEQDEEMDTS